MGSSELQKAQKFSLKKTGSLKCCLCYTLLYSASVFHNLFALWPLKHTVCHFCRRGSLDQNNNKRRSLMTLSSSVRSWELSSLLNNHHCQWKSIWRDSDRRRTLWVVWFTLTFALYGDSMGDRTHSKRQRIIMFHHDWAIQTIVNNRVASWLVRRLPSSLSDSSSGLSRVSPEVIANRGSKGDMTPLTDDQMKQIVTLIKMTDFSGFEHCWKHLG